MKWMGLEEMFELYGSTEAAISTFRRKGDPRGSVGEVTDAAVQILDPDGKECAAAEIGPDGKLLNYEQCVGEICRVAADTGLFQGYFDNPKANTDKFRDGVYHSGDLGHILVKDGRRYLFFDGRTDDWIRKDGENFSAGQVGRLIGEHPDVALAVAYGVPCSISDELVMAAIKLRDGAALRSARLLRLVRGAGERRQHGPQVDARLRAPGRRLRVHPDAEGTGAQREEGALRSASQSRRGDLLAAAR